MCSAKLISDNFHHEFFAEFGCILYNLHYFSTKFLLKDTLFRNYGFLFKDLFYIMLPSSITFQTIGKVLNKIDLLGLKLNNKFYLKKESFNLFLELSYEKSAFLFVGFLQKCLKQVSILYRNDVN